MSFVGVKKKGVVMLNKVSHWYHWYIYLPAGAPVVEGVINGLIWMFSASTTGSYIKQGQSLVHWFMGLLVYLFTCQSTSGRGSCTITTSVGEGRMADTSRG